MKALSTPTQRGSTCFGLKRGSTCFQLKKDLLVDFGGNILGGNFCKSFFTPLISKSDVIWIG